jgi:parallel beta-helix repeat protein
VLGTLPDVKTLQPREGMVIRESVRLEPGVYFLPEGIRVEKDHVQVEGQGVLLVGNGRQGRGLLIQGCHDVTITGLSLTNYYHGIYAEDCSNLSIKRCLVFGTHEEPPNTLFLDIWLPLERAYGSALCLARCEKSLVEENLFQHQQNGILTYGCRDLTVRRNECSYNSGWGIHLYETSDSLFEENNCDYCCRFEPREGGLHHGHMGADSAGFLIVKNSCRNVFCRNRARMGGDGFFLAGLTPEGEACGCNENVFENNDASLSPNISFEATFCENNVFRENIASRSNFGFWLGYSKNFLIEGNQILLNRQAGIAVENGVHFVVRNNHFQGNKYGVLLWSRHHPLFARAYPDRDTSRDWDISHNHFRENHTAIRIAAHQDHGIRPLKDPSHHSPALPHSHSITHNDIQDNRIGVELVSTHKNLIQGNILHKNVEANIRLSDAEDNQILANLGERGAYL